MAVPFISNAQRRNARMAAQPQAHLGGRWGDRAYVAAGQSGDGMVHFNPRSRSADGEILPDRTKIASRSRSMVRNNGWAAGFVSKEVDAVIGSRFRPMPKPDFGALGLSPEWAVEFKRQIQSNWRAYAEDPLNMADMSRSQSVAQMFGMSYRTYVIEGDGLGEIGWRTDRRIHTCLRVIDPDLMSNPMDAPDTQYLRGGVDMDDDGAAWQYHFRQAHENTLYPTSATYEWLAIPREETWGRPRVLHHFDKMRDGQTRGVSRLAPILESLQMEDHYGRMELQAAILNAALALFVRSPMDTNTMVDALEDTSSANGVKAYEAARADFHGQGDGIMFGGARIPHLFPGEEIESVSATRPASQFGDFESAVLRRVSSGLDISYEQLSSDWSKTNYSSARAALIEVWRGFTSKRQSFAQGFCQPFYLAWLEEQIVEGHIKLPPGAPDFYDAWPHYTRAKWVGPGKGFVDPVKEVTAAALRVQTGLSTMEDEAAELTGSDHDENLAQIRMEIAAMKDMGVLHPAQEGYAKLLMGGLSGQLHAPNQE